MIYIASSYTRDPDRSVALQRQYGQYLIAQGLPCYSPVVHGHFLQRTADYEYWVRHGLDMLNRCSEMHVVESEELPYAGSRGVGMEIVLAHVNGISTRYFRQQDYTTWVEREPCAWVAEVVAAGVAARKAG